MARRRKISREDPVIPLEIDPVKPEAIFDPNWKAKRYILFAGNFERPKGGWNDYRSARDTIRQCFEVLQKLCRVEKVEWFQIVDLKTMRVVKRSVEQPYK